MRRTSAEPDRILDKTTFNLGVQRWHALIIKWNLATHEDIEYDAETPHIDLWTGVHFCIQ